MLSLPKSLQCRPSSVFPKIYTALTCTVPIVNRESIVFYFLCHKKLTNSQIHLYVQKNSFTWNLSHGCLKQQNRTQESTWISKQSTSYGKKFIQLRNNFKHYKILQNHKNCTRQYHCYCPSLPPYSSFSALFSLTDLPLLTVTPSYFCLPSSLISYFLTEVH